MYDTIVALLLKYDIKPSVVIVS